MLELTYHSDTTVPVEAEAITPDTIAGKSLDEVSNLTVQHGNRTAKLADFFEVAGSTADPSIAIRGDCSRVKLIGSEMTRGRIEIHGNAGMHLGAEMKGGEIVVHGNAGDWVGAEMKGGHIHVHGDAGHLIGAGYRGARAGMRGGVILIDGKAGNEIGSVMRRGLIAIGGDSGDFPGVSMIAGSVFVFGKPGLRPGAGMKRGSVVLWDTEPRLLPTFRKDCRYRPTFLRFYLRQFREWGFPLPENALDQDWNRYRGDFVALGKGEVLVRCPCEAN